MAHLLGGIVASLGLQHLRARLNGGPQLVRAQVAEQRLPGRELATSAGGLVEEAQRMTESGLWSVTKSVTSKEDKVSLWQPGVFAVPSDMDLAEQTWQRPHQEQDFGATSNATLVVQLLQLCGDLPGCA